jgi:tRNA1Val (adenine37-N6)-methyltransferase
LEVTEGHLLGGRLRYAQPRHGFRSGIEPVLLAATIPARAGQRVLEAGSGAGAGLLCLAARVAGIRALGIERDPALVELAGRNARANGFPDLAFRAADIGTLSDVGVFDHAFANPPYHAADGTRSADPGVETAKRAGADLFAIWAARMAGCLRARGTLSWIVATPSVPACILAFGAAGTPAAVLLPLWPHADQPAKLSILHGVKGGRGRFRVAPGLVLHEAGGFTDRAQSILRAGSALPL